MAKNFLRFGVWNIEGLHGKLNDTDFLSKINHFDLISLVETWLPYGNPDVHIDGYCSFSKCRKEKSLSSRRNSGGITILVKQSLQKGVKFLDKDSNEEFVWWKLDKSFFNLTNDIFVCSVYIPPQNSSREIRLNTDHFENLRNYIHKFSALGDVILCGDFDALDDFTHVDPFLNEGNLSTITVSKRFSRDLNTNCYGTSLVELCIENNLVALNGRTKGDLTGQFTCITYNGSSVVDYAIVAQELFPLINSFTVDYPNEFSHHSCLNFVMKIKTPKHPNVNMEILNKPISFVWDETKKQDLYDVMSSEDTVNKLESLFCEQNDADSSLVDIDAIVNNFSEVLCESSLKILKRNRQINKNKNKKQRQKWYDKNCHTLKKNLRNLGKLLSKYPNDPFLRHNFFAKRKEKKRSFV